MARGRTMYARAARRAAMTLPMLPRNSGIELAGSAERRFMCPYCSNSFDSDAGRNRHILLRPHCRTQHLHATRKKKNPRPKRKRKADAPQFQPPAGEPPLKQPRTYEGDTPGAGPSRLPASTVPHEGSVQDDTEAEPEGGLYIENFPVRTAGAPVGTARKGETGLREYLSSCGPLGDRDLFETAEILMTTGLTGRGRTKHLKGPLYKEKTPWKDNAALLRDIDRLPKGPKWSTAKVSVGEGSYMRSHTVYLRDILEVIRELLGASRFKHHLRYTPERHWTSRNRRHRVYDEMWSGDWWWRMQVSPLNPPLESTDDPPEYLIRNKSGTVVPLIIATDETTLTNNPQGPKGYPVYLSIGNISKSVRRRPTKRAMVIVGYLPVDPFDDVSNEDLRKRYRGELLHQSLGTVFEPLRLASSNGMLAWCADGHLRHVYPIIAAWVADWPEQNDIACTFRNGCPKCLQKWRGRGRGGTRAPLRDPDVMTEALREYSQTKLTGELKKLRLKPCTPFWEGIEHVDIGMSLTPDLLHQLYKGMFEHVRDWVEDLLGTQEFNRRFKAMPSVYGLRYFHKGVTKVKVWAGRESREMMRQFLPIVIDAQAPPDFVRLVRALLDFSYLAHYEQLSDADLVEMDRLLALFHQAKKVLISPLEIVAGMGAFDRLPKLHMLSHYTQSIRDLGTPDGYSTETPEHLHIIYVKNGWRMSNRRNPLPQIVKYVQRLEAIQIQRTFIDEYYGETKDIGDEGTAMLYGDDDDEDPETEGTAGPDSSNYEDDDNEDDDDDICMGSEDQETYYTRRYPRPTISIARHPTIPQVPGRVLISSYGASDLIRALHCFLAYKTGQSREGLFILPSDVFDVWHKVTLRHPPPPFAPNHPCHCDVIRVHPLVRDHASRIKKDGLFDTALFAASRNGEGITRFRAGRVRAIFKLPPRLQHLHPGPLVYLEVFHPFMPDSTNSHRLFSTSRAYLDEMPASIVLPLSTLSMACHLAPNFDALPMRLPQPHSADRYLATDHFLFNEYYNHFTYLWAAYWRQQD